MHGNERLIIPVHLKRKMIEIARQFRKESTRGEEILWQTLRGKQLQGRRFRRQQPLGPFIVDFFCAEERLIVEVDGPIHLTKPGADRERQTILESLKFRFLRFSSAAVENNVARVRTEIARAFRPHPPAPSPTRGEGENSNSDHN